jgi:hypothetical protein
MTARGFSGISRRARATVRSRRVSPPFYEQPLEAFYRVE